MEPRSAERGNNFARRLLSEFAICFNGATLSRTWKHLRQRSRAPVERASMEPRSAERGNRRRDRVLAFDEELQWSHAQPNVETARLRRSPSRRRVYMQLQWSHAQPNVETVENVHRFDSFQSASMEPRSAERGNVQPRISPFINPVLQWSHAQPNVETEFFPLPFRADVGLQWSHAQPNVETNVIGIVVEVFPSFNGATLSRTWKHRHGDGRLPP